jgi:aspartyl-tRNA(Asn)/glutamyl-tRNA(Gln) amidotransferase subunit B
MELVTEPVIHDAKTAGDFARELQLLLRTLGVSDANMEKGEMRVEANISVNDSDSFGTKVEVKNLNSFKSVESAIAYEIKRHIEVLESGAKVVQETRGWDETKGNTFSQRVKETAHDYRYFPDPDLPKLDISKHAFNIVLPSLPQEKREKYNVLGLTREQVEIIISNIDTDNFFICAVSKLNEDPNLIKLFANYLIADLLPKMEEGKGVSKCHLDQFVKLIQMLHENMITSRVAKDLLREAVIEGLDPENLAQERGLLQESAQESILPIVEQILRENPSVVADYKAGKEASLQFLIGQGMKISKGSANPQVLAELIRKKIG